MKNVLRNILSGLSDLAQWLFRWYVDRVTTSWRREFNRLRGLDNKWIWIGLSIFFTIFLLPYLAKESFSDGLLLGLSFIWSTFLAVSFGYILRHPLSLILVYVGVVFGRAVADLFTSAKEAAITGNVVGAVILFSLGIYLIVWVNNIKTGAIFVDSTPPTKSTRGTSRKRRRVYRKRR